MEFYSFLNRGVLLIFKSMGLVALDHICKEKYVYRLSIMFSLKYSTWILLITKGKLYFTFNILGKKIGRA